MNEFQRKIEFLRPAYNKRDPDPEKDYGVGCVIMRLSLVGPLGAVSWEIFTGWHLDQTWDEWAADNNRYVRPRSMAMGGAVAIHSKKPLTEWDHSHEGTPCDLIDDGVCWADLSFLAGDSLFKKLVEEGEEAVFDEMHNLYRLHLEVAGDMG